MADAARSVRHYVSDCLAERHPYDVQKGFAGRPARDAGKVFDGFAYAGGLDGLVNSLADVSINDEEHTKAARFLYSHSASQEAKIELIQKGVVPITVSVIYAEPSATLEHQCFQLLRSLCVIPEGCYPVVQCGGVEAALRAIRNPSADKNGKDRMQARTIAAHVIAQVASDFAGLRWILRAEHCDEFILSGVEYPVASQSRPSAGDNSPAASAADDLTGELTAAPAPAELVAGLVATMAEEPLGASRLALHCATSLAQFTAIAPGIRLMTENHEQCGATEEQPSFLMLVAEQLDLLIHSIVTHVEDSTDRIASLAVGSTMGLLYLGQLLTVVWNVALDQTGVEILGSLDVPNSLFWLLAVVSDSEVQSRIPLSVQRLLMGALSAVYKLTPVKLASVHVPTEEELPVEQTFPTRVDLLLAYLRSTNDIIDAARASGKPPSNDTIAISKNTVQCIRLASEIKPVRDMTHAFLDALDKKEGTNEGFYVRRQLYCGTRFEEEYRASV